MSPLRNVSPRRIVSGVEATRATEALERQADKRNAWPYDWTYPSPSAKRYRTGASIIAPAVSTQTLVASLTVPNGFQFYLTHLLQLYNGTGYVVGSTDVTWTLDVNITVGATAPPGYVLQGFGSTFFPLGGLQGGLFAPYPLVKPERLAPNDILRSKVTLAATSGIPSSAGNYFITFFEGWLEPDDQPE